MTLYIVVLVAVTLLSVLSDSSLPVSVDRDASEWRALGHYYESKYDYANACNAYAEASAAKKLTPWSYYVRLKAMQRCRDTNRDEWISFVSEVEEDLGKSFGKVINISRYRVLSIAYNELKMYKKSWKFMLKANAAAHSGRPLPSPTEDETTAANMSHIMTTEIIESWTGSNSTVPIFILSTMGSNAYSLVSALLRKHSTVCSPGIMMGWVEQFHSQLKYFLQLLSTGNDIDRKTLQPVIMETIDRIERSIETVQCSSSHTVVGPISPIYVGLLHILFPRAMIVNVMHDPLDSVINALYSISGASSPESVAYRFLSSMRVVTHFEYVVPNRVVHIRYADIRNSPHVALNSILQRLGTVWEEHMALTPVESTWYSEQIEGRWIHYQNELENLRQFVYKDLMSIEEAFLTLPLRNYVNWDLDVQFYCDALGVMSSESELPLRSDRSIGTTVDNRDEKTFVSHYNHEYDYDTNEEDEELPEFNIRPESSNAGSLPAQQLTASVHGHEYDEIGSDEGNEALPLRRGRNRGGALEFGSSAEMGLNVAPEALMALYTKYAPMDCDQNEIQAMIARYALSDPEPSANKLIAIAYMRLESGTLNHAIDILEKLYAIYPSREVLKTLCQVHARSGDHSRALDIVSELIESRPFEALGYSVRAELSWKLFNDAEGAERDVDTALYICPTDAAMLLLKCELLTRRGRLSDARVIATRATEVSLPSSRQLVLAYDALGLVELFIGIPQSARLNFQSALAIASDSSDVMCHIVRANLDLGQWKTARDYLLTMKKDKPSCDATTMLADLYYRLGMPVASVTTIELTNNESDLSSNRLFMLNVKSFIAIAHIDKAVSLVRERYDQEIEVWAEWNDIVTALCLWGKYGYTKGSDLLMTVTSKRIKTACNSALSGVWNNDLLPDQVVDVDRSVLNRLVSVLHTPLMELFPFIHMRDVAYSHAGTVPDVRYGLSLAFSVLDFGVEITRQTTVGSTPGKTVLSPCSAGTLDLLCGDTGGNGKGLLNVMEHILNWFLVVEPTNIGHVMWSDISQVRYTDIPVINGDQVEKNMVPYHDMLVTVLKQEMSRAGLYILPFPTSTPQLVRLNKEQKKNVHNAQSFKELYSIIGQDFDIQIHTANRHNGGSYHLSSIRLSQLDPNDQSSFRVTIRTSRSEAKSKLLQASLLEAYQQFFESYIKKESSYTLRTHAALILYFWYHLNPLTIGTEFTGLGFLYGAVALSGGVSRCNLQQRKTYPSLYIKSMLQGNADAFVASVHEWLRETCTSDENNGRKISAVEIYLQHIVDSESIESILPLAVMTSPVERLHLTSILAEGYPHKVYPSLAEMMEHFEQPHDVSETLVGSVISNAEASVALLIVSAMEEYEFGEDFMRKRESSLLVADPDTVPNRKRDIQARKMVTAVDRYHDDSGYVDKDGHYWDADCYNYDHCDMGIDYGYESNDSCYEYQYNDDTCLRRVYDNEYDCNYDYEYDVDSYCDCYYDYVYYDDEDIDEYEYDDDEHYYDSNCGYVYYDDEGFDYYYDYDNDGSNCDYVYYDDVDYGTYHGDEYYYDSVYDYVDVEYDDLCYDGYYEYEYNGDIVYNIDYCDIDYDSYYEYEYCDEYYCYGGYGECESSDE